MASGERIFAVSAMKTTPANTIIFAGAFRACMAEKVGVALEIGHPVDDLRLDVGVSEDDRAFLVLQAVDLQGQGRNPRQAS